MRFWILLLAGFAFAQQPRARISTIEAPDDRAVSDAICADVDGDGRVDLVVSVSGDNRRTLRVHLQQDGAALFNSQAAYELDLTEDVCAYAVGDVHVDPGSELVLFNAKGAFAWRPTAPEEERYVRLVSGAFLWQLAERWKVWAWQDGVRDIDGDGLDDLLLPQHGGYLLGFQERSVDDALFKTLTVRLPGGDYWHNGLSLAAMRERRITSSRRMGERFKLTDLNFPMGPLVQVAEAVPAPHFRDFDGDGDLDLIAQSPAELLVWLRGSTGPGAVRGYAAEPSLRFPLPVAADRKARLDISYSAHTADLDGDGRADCVTVTSNTEDDIRTQVLIYLQGRGQPADAPIFGEEGVPQQLLLLDGFTGIPRFTDVDGDGLPDLVIGAVRPDLIDTMRASASKKLDVELYVFLNRDGAFSRSPDLTQIVPVSAEGLRNSRREIVSRFFADISGDGALDLLLRDEPTRLRVLKVEREGDGVEVEGTVLWEATIDEGARLEIAERPQGHADVLVIEGKQILHVRFR